MLRDLCTRRRLAGGEGGKRGQCVWGGLSVKKVEECACCWCSSGVSVLTHPRERQALMLQQRDVEGPLHAQWVIE
jgi:hypothetical protein